MIETGEILQTMRMIQEENFDIRTITLGINLLDCSDSDAQRCADRVYDKICCRAEKPAWMYWTHRKAGSV